MRHNLSFFWMGTALFLILSVFSCKSQKGKFEFIHPKSGAHVTKGDVLALNFKYPETSIDSIVISLNGEAKERVLDTGQVNLSTEELGFGNYNLSAKVYYSGSEDIAYSNIVIVPPPAKKMGYTVVKEYPHDTKAFTQGLEFKNGFLYESTGKYGESSLRKVRLETGEVLQKIELDDQYFGEGLTIIDNKLIQLTWMENVGFVYDLNTFELLSTFDYQDRTQGWGICYDGEHVYKTDGSNKLYILDSQSYKSKHVVYVHDENGPVDSLNELEFINGKIWANIYSQEDLIVVIDPKTGAVEQKINFKGMYTENRSPADNEMNGIAYDKANDRVFVTGKNWSKLFEVKLTDL
ncbi:MAG TPA: glutaminyl-peptide cyclotransferase [Candidatus Sphingobacterium stercoripullorum]|nr:glutaminyl-peptide cyclotransferase [Candidatus Sphingobacterium stercoripullorum]